MVPADATRRILSLAKVVHRWLGALSSLDFSRRDRVANYSDEIAGTLQRAADALTRLEADPTDKGAQRTVVRELGRIAGYVETIVGALEHHLDGRKLAGVKRRLEQLTTNDSAGLGPLHQDRGRMDRLLAAEGYFRALADGLRA